MHKIRIEFVVAALLWMTAGSGWAASSDAAVSGVVRDAQGVAQMGALVQILGSDATLVRTAYTDLSGHYRVENLLPGRYQVRATLALFTPAIRSNLRLPVGARAVVDLTLSTVFQSTSWLPAERRRADEPSDDWKWTLRSAANRPILRMIDDDGQILVVSSSATEAHKPAQHVSAAVTSGDGGFGLGGVHHKFSVDTAFEDGSDIVLRGDLGSELSATGRAPTADFDAGYERKIGFDGAARVVMNVQSHPEMRSTGGAAGLGSIRLATAQKTKLGDLLDVEYGSSVTAIRVSGVGMATMPFMRMTVHPVENWSVGYRMATSRELQSYEALDALQGETPVAAMANGRLAIEKGMHNEFAISRTDGRGLVQVAFYHDAIHNAGIAGTGILSPDDLQRPGVQGLLIDTMTDSFRLLSNAYSAQGVRVTISEPITQGLSVAFAASSGAALSTRDCATTLQAASEGMRVRQGQTATIALKGRVAGTGTKIRAAYRWQPRSMVTSVDAYAPFSDQSFLSFYLSQPLRFGGVLPTGLNAVVDVTNLLEQGYQPLISKDGRTVFLAQSPRVIQAGLSYTF
ncbi:carboxypeptidase-like regulatory domain-containing protein [Granulicella pectinivorans]|uniref:carboxypeptidase-like regulatory domain-containing protein n=1 Tax=Granulicella pectinivorans TaxID=474950 RepID=UPI0015873C85|nr:carboxypeptidase-like regulatory domain-containing protein [Granulicella pectinivorans]